MKTKMTKKIFAVLMVMALTLSMAVTAFAADNGKGSLTISGTKGKQVDIYQMFSATWKDNAPAGTIIEPEDIVAYTLNSDWEAFFNKELVDANVYTAATLPTGTALSDAAYTYVSNFRSELDNSIDQFAINQFAQRASQYALAVKDYSTGTALTATKTVTAESNTGDTVTFSNVDAGYYLVIPKGAVSKVDTDDNIRKNATLVNVPAADNATLAIKGQYPTIDKKADGEDNNTAKVGDDVTFTLESAVPDMSDYATYKFSFVDTMSNGLTFKPYATDDTTTPPTVIKPVYVTIGGKEIPLNDASATPPVTTGYTFSESIVSGKTQLTIAFNNLKEVKTVNNEAVNMDDTIIVTYKATVNSNAVIGTAGNDNSAHVEYSNNPQDSNETTPSTGDTSKVYTYEVELDKYTGTYGAEATRLAGATFEIRPTADGTPIKLVSTGTNDEYRVATQEQINDASVTKYPSVTTPNNGKIKIKGLAANTVYYLVETAAPTGYNKLAEPVTVEIKVTNNDYENPSYVVNSDTNNANSTGAVPVKNESGTLLPVTGGIGTIGLTVLGVGVVIFGFVFTSKKKKKAE